MYSKEHTARFVPDYALLPCILSCCNGTVGGHVHFQEKSLTGSRALCCSFSWFTPSSAFLDVSLVPWRLCVRTSLCFLPGVFFALYYRCINMTADMLLRRNVSRTVLESAYTLFCFRMQEGLRIHRALSSAVHPLPVPSLFASASFSDEFTGLPRQWG